MIVEVGSLPHWNSILLIIIIIHDAVFVCYPESYPYPNDTYIICKHLNRLILLACLQCDQHNLHYPLNCTLQPEIAAPRPPWS